MNKPFGDKPKYINKKNKTKDYEGITNKYRQTEEYKFLVRETQRRNPKMDLFVIEMMIDTYKSVPNIDEYVRKIEKSSNEGYEEYLKNIKTEYTTMNVYNNPDEFPEDYKQLQMQIEKERLKREIEELEKEFSEVEVNE